MKKTPLRKCCGCQQMIEKSKLIRVVRTENEFFIDTTLRANGRGAYVCNKKECLNLAQKNRGFERSFKTKIPQEVYEELLSKIGE